MAKSKALVVYYSRTGTTRRLAGAISAAIPCDVEEIFDTRNRVGVLGYLRSGFDALLRRRTVLEPTRYDPAFYDLLIVGTPVWNASVSAPVRTYLTTQKGRIKQVAFFCTCGGVGADRAFRQMTDVCGVEPRDVLAVRQIDVERGDDASRVQAFVAGLARRRAA